MNAGTSIKTGRPEFDELYPRIRSFLEKDYLDIVIDNKQIRGYRSPDAKSIWIRDHSDMMRGFKYFETDLKSAVEHFAETQASNGRIFDYFTIFPEKLPGKLHLQLEMRNSVGLPQIQRGDCPFAGIHLPCLSCRFSRIAIRHRSFVRRIRIPGLQLIPALCPVRL